jgi:hypothetical protein
MKKKVAQVNKAEECGRQQQSVQGSGGKRVPTFHPLEDAHCRRRDGFDRSPKELQAPLPFRGAGREICSAPPCGAPFQPTERSVAPHPFDLGEDTTLNAIASVESC